MEVGCPGSNTTAAVVGTGLVGITVITWVGAKGAPPDPNAVGVAVGITGAGVTDGRGVGLGSSVAAREIAGVGSRAAAIVGGTVACVRVGEGTRVGAGAMVMIKGGTGVAVGDGEGEGTGLTTGSRLAAI